MAISWDDFIPSKWYYEGRVRTVRLVILHATQSPEQSGAARATANFFAHLPPENKASAHVCVDAYETIGCVKPTDTAFAVPNANADGFSIEQVGYSEQSAEDWQDPYSQAVIARAAVVGRQAAEYFNIPMEWLDVEQVASGAAGFTDHKTCSAALGGTHWDPGFNYPHDQFMSLVRGEQGDNDEMDAQQSTAALMILTDLQKRALTPDQMTALFDPKYGLYKKVADLEATVAAIAQKVGA